MYRTKNCGELRIADVEKNVTLSGWATHISARGMWWW